MKNKIVVSVVRASLVVGFFLSTNLALSFPLIPDPNWTQGDLCTIQDPDFVTYKYQENIPYCQRNVSSDRREKIYDEYKIPSDCRHRYTIDHFIPLSIGGSNSDINLWPEHVLVKATRRQLEQELYFALEEGEIRQKEAIEIIVKEKTKEKQFIINKNKKAKDECD
ncbi:MAG: hypothetical protein A3A72_03745 [Deltaproteobacteria bacterium RIFCSPLOWO2_01_FULL_38_9]|nr:MAG: hypothetical protein A3A72_03745 [Deltaproteobacteria bacterium RIFCSPLOWO2_01_FULL_38_9]